MYCKVHRIHHTYAAPFGLAAEYASPWETLMLGVGTKGPPLLLALFGGDVHLMNVLTSLEAGAFRSFQAIDAHSEYDFPRSLRH